MKRVSNFVIALVLLLLAGCGGKTSESMDAAETLSPEPEQSADVIETLAPIGLPSCTTIVEGTSFTSSVTNYHAGFHPTYCASWLKQNVYEALTGFVDSAVLEPMGIIAESWTVSDDNLTWNFAIREGTAFSDGTLCDADAVAACFNEMHKTAIGFVSCEAKEGNIVSFTLLEPNENFAEDLTEFYVCSVSAMELYGADSHLGAVGTGPYVLSEYSETSALLKANPYCSFAPRSPQVEEIHLIIDAFEDVNIELERFLNRETDHIAVYGNQGLEDIKSTVGEVEVTKSYGTLNCIWMNGDYDPPFSKTEISVLPLAALSILVP